MKMQYSSIQNPNIQDLDILHYQAGHKFENQRQLADATGYALGTVNQSLNRLTAQGYLTKEYMLTARAWHLMQESTTKRAVILAAGAGMRMIPIHTQMTKGMLEVRGERLAERLIRQLQEAGIFQICIVVGFMKEQYEYLIDKYHVTLMVNRDYMHKNNLYSAALARTWLDHAYIVPCDLWCLHNPFRKHELYSWYMVSERKMDESYIRCGRRQQLYRCSGQQGNQMIGIAYLEGETAACVRKRLEQLTLEKGHENDFWEEALWEGDRMIVSARCVPHGMVYEINTYEQLRELDAGSGSLDSEIIRTVAGILQVPSDEVRQIEVLKKGMTNRSFCCTCRGKRYIMRIPGEGTAKLMNRKAEAQVYHAIKDARISDRVLHIDPVTGYKLTVFEECAHVCDASDKEEVKKCMRFLRGMHEQDFHVDHTFDLWEHVEYYESLREQTPSVYQDYLQTKQRVYELKSFIDSQKKDWTLTHIDAVADNFLFKENGEIVLLDWEYAGMQDPHVDIAMFAVYALYDREQVDFLIDAYFPEGVQRDTRLKIYCYIAVCGLLWSNWCEYKSLQGVDFGEYNLRQYRYAKEYYKIFQEEWQCMRQNGH